MDWDQGYSVNKNACALQKKKIFQSGLKSTVTYSISFLTCVHNNVGVVFSPCSSQRAEEA